MLGEVEMERVIANAVDQRACWYISCGQDLSSSSLFFYSTDTGLKDFAM